MTAAYLPIVHINGTSRDELISQRTHFADAMRTALDALGDMTLNQRDLYPDPNAGRFDRAKWRHDAYRSNLARMIADIEAEALANVD